MKSLQDALYNWLTIKVVVDARPDDTAARETMDLFRSILDEEHKVTDITVSKDDSMYHLVVDAAGESKKARFPIELIDVMVNQIQSEPEKYRNY